MRLECDKVDAVLADFILSLSRSKPVSRTRLQVDGRLLGALAGNPSPALIQAWQELVRQKFLYSAQVLQGAKRISVTPSLLGVTVILNNLCAAAGEFNSPSWKRAALHDRNLFDRLSIPRTEADILSFDLLISAYGDFLRRDEAALDLDQLQIDLLNFSPFTALKSLDLILPSPLQQLLPLYLPHRLAENDFVESEQWWSAVDEILGQPGLVYSLHHAWLKLSENRLSCLGLGLFFEEIRRRGKNDDLILSFFEAYEFLQKFTGTGSTVIRVDLLDLIKTQLTASGESLSGRRLNQVGNEYFMKFRALLEIVAARGGVPGEFRHLSHSFYFKRLLPLVSLATISGGQRFEQKSLTKFGEVKFS